MTEDWNGGHTQTETIIHVYHFSADMSRESKGSYTGVSEIPEWSITEQWGVERDKMCTESR